MGLSIVLLLRTVHSHSPDYQQNMKLKNKLLEPSVFLHCFNPITPKAEADRSLVRPGWTVTWYLSHAQQQSNIVIQQSKAKTKHTKASMVICYGNSTFLSKRRKKTIRVIFFSHIWVIRTNQQMLSNFFLTYRAFHNCKNIVVLYLLTVCTYCTFPEARV